MSVHGVCVYVYQYVFLFVLCVCMSLRILSVFVYECMYACVVGCACVHV